jgi:hypothetical protein
MAQLADHGVNTAPPRLPAGSPGRAASRAMTTRHRHRHRHHNCCRHPTPHNTLPFDRFKASWPTTASTLPPACDGLDDRAHPEMSWTVAGPEPAPTAVSYTAPASHGVARTPRRVPTSTTTPSASRRIWRNAAATTTGRSRRSGSTGSSSRMYTRPDKADRHWRPPRRSPHRNAGPPPPAASPQLP